MTLPNDVSRCVGRFGLGPDDPICERRTNCARYLSMLDDRDRRLAGSPARVPVATGPCRDGDDFYMPVIA